MNEPQGVRDTHPGADPALSAHRTRRNQVSPEPIGCDSFGAPIYEWQLLED